MQNIQDKEFDQLFKDKFESAEMQPSAGLWPNIAAELQPAAKRRLPVYWMAAALALMVAGLALLMPRTEKIRLQAPVKLSLQKETTVPVVSAAPVSHEAAPEVTLAYKSTPLVIAPRLKADESKPERKVVQAQQSPNRLVYKQKEVAPEPAPLSGTAALNESLIASADVEKSNISGSAVARTEEAAKGIRNVGDLINFVVNKVDRREKKIIQFETDDDNSSIVALNIGFIKFNRKSDK